MKPTLGFSHAERLTSCNKICCHYKQLICTNYTTIRCYLCYRRVIEDSIDAIPSATAPIDEFNCCDVCKRKDEKFKYAQMYCVVCAKKLCDSHLKVRNSQCNVTVGLTTNGWSTNH